MNALRRTLYLQALVWFVAGAALAIAPETILVHLFDQPHYQEFAWHRLFGIQAVGLALLMVLVAHRIEDLWWWSWSFALVTTAMAGVVVLNTAFALGPRESATLWWIFSGVSVLFAFSLLYGLFASSREQPLP